MDLVPPHQPRGLAVVDRAQTAIVVLVLAVFTVFVLVGIAGYRRRADTGANTAITLAAIGVSLIVLGFFAVDTLRNAPWTFVAIIVIALLAIVLDAAWKRRAPAPDDQPRVDAAADLAPGGGAPVGGTG